VVDIPLTRREFLKLLSSAAAAAAAAFVLSTFGFKSIFDNLKMQNNNSGGRARAKNHRSGGRLE
jgi:hypothetical protein